MNSAYHPRIDGQIERIHRTLKQNLCCLLSEVGLYGSQWYTLLIWFEFSLNCQNSSSTSFSLAGVIFEQKLVNPIDIVIGTVI